MQLVEYIRKDGTNPFRVWFDQLDKTAAVKVSVAQARLALGNTSNGKWFRGIGEYRIDTGPGYRVYLAQDRDTLTVLFGGSTKRRQQVAINDAIAMHEEYRARKAELKEQNKGAR